tara:strand:+ start:1565 stop:2656 length:1092 start_codon:yes stop_codon:yes gene_type:complete
MSTFTRFNSGDIVLSTEKVNSNAWTDSTNELTTFFTASTEALNYANPSSSGMFFLDIFKTAADAAAATSTGSVEFSIAYGHKAGSGSTVFSTGTGGAGFGASRAIYSQYRQLVYGDENQNFTFNGTTPDDIFVINIERARIKQGLKPASLNLQLVSGSAGTGNRIHLTDDSITTTGSATLTNLGRQFNLVSGSSGTMLGSTLAQTTSGSYGFVYPDAGIIVLNPAALKCKIGSLTLPDGAGPTASIHDITTAVAPNIHGFNNRKLYHAISGAGSFVVDAEEKVSSQFYFSRITNQEFNYSTNPSFTKSDGVLQFDSMANNPKVFITTIGLYNDSNELLATAKLSQPLAKDFTKEALVRIKLDY